MENFLWSCNFADKGECVDGGEEGRTITFN